MLTTQDSWDLHQMEIIGNSSYAHRLRLMALSRRQLNIAKYSKVKHNWCYILKLPYIFSLPLAYLIPFYLFWTTHLSSPYLTLFAFPGLLTFPTYLYL